MNLLLLVAVGLCFVQTCFLYERTVANPLWNETVVDKLRNDLLTNYDRYAKPSHQTPTNISIGFGIYYLETDEVNSTFSVAVSLRLSWSDPKLVWNSEDYEGVRFFTVTDHEIWLPDLYLLNSASSGGEAIARYGNALAVAYSNGVIFWVAPLRFSVLCHFDLFYWPLDTQHCQLKFGSWSYSGKDLQLVLDQVYYEDSVNISQWSISSRTEIATIQRNLYPDDFHQAVLHLTLTRKPTCISSVTITTTITAALLLLTQQLILKKTDAIVLGSLVSPAFCLCLLYFGSVCASASWIVIYFSTCLFLNVISALKLVLLDQKRQVPWLIKMQLHGKFGRFLLLNDFLAQYSDWDLFTVAIDRIFLLSYVFILVVLFLIYLI